MDILTKLLDKDEKILWKREIWKNLIPDRNKYERAIKRHLLRIPFVGFLWILMILLIMFNYLTYRSIFFLIILTSLLLDRFRYSFKHQLKLYELMRKYHSDDILRNYPKLEVITDKHVIRFEPNQYGYPFWLDINISDIYQYREEFNFFNISKLTNICKYIKPRKNRYGIRLYFEINQKIVGDDAP